MMPNRLNIVKEFVKHRKSPEKAWMDSFFEITYYFQEWIGGLEVNTFEKVRDLVSTDQVKKQVPYEIREHFLDEWEKLISP
ncbi:CCHC-type domain-containing protein [Nephila pilipes]|uniref:CCHC-type domain-containing protein n=1 Tax=Nephila pilipes TaxID=299642 RepID=A0A8X6MN25_NEPPI|nr:CCHC-type domain-containing protein [Nephila pilipes]